MPLFDISSGLCRLGYLPISNVASLRSSEFISYCIYDVLIAVLIVLFSQLERKRSEVGGRLSLVQFVYSAFTMDEVGIR